MTGCGRAWRASGGLRGGLRGTRPLLRAGDGQLAMDGGRSRQSGRPRAGLMAGARGQRSVSRATRRKRCESGQAGDYVSIHFAI